MAFLLCYRIVMHMIPLHCADQTKSAELLFALSHIVQMITMVLSDILIHAIDAVKCT